MMPSLYRTCSGTSSQCSSVWRSRDKPRSNLWTYMIIKETGVEPVTCRSPVWCLNCYTTTPHNIAGRLKYECMPTNYYLFLNRFLIMWQLLNAFFCMHNIHSIQFYQLEINTNYQNLFQLNRKKIHSNNIKKVNVSTNYYNMVLSKTTLWECSWGEKVKTSSKSRDVSKHWLGVSRHCYGGSSPCEKLQPLMNQQFTKHWHQLSACLGTTCFHIVSGSVNIWQEIISNHKI